MKNYLYLIITLVPFFWMNTLIGQSWSTSTGVLYANPTTTKVGIGVSSPNATLTVNSTSSSLDPLNVKILNTTKFQILSTGGVSIDGILPPANGLGVKQINIGDPQLTADYKLKIISGWNDWVRFNSAANSSYWGFHNSSSQIDFLIYHVNTSGQQIWPFTIRNNGNIEMLSLVIGTATLPSDSKLAVNGKITCEEVEVKDIAADFVFEEGYNLRSLNEVDFFIKKYGHLPDIKPASETSQGVNLGELNQSLLQKIEELTLYIIDLNKRIGVLEKENSIKQD